MPFLYCLRSYSFMTCLSKLSSFAGSGWLRCWPAMVPPTLSETLSKAYLAQVLLRVRARGVPVAWRSGPPPGDTETHGPLTSAWQHPLCTCTARCAAGCTFVSLRLWSASHGWPCHRPRYSVAPLPTSVNARKSGLSSRRRLGGDDRVLQGVAGWCLLPALSSRWHARCVCLADGSGPQDAVRGAQWFVRRRFSALVPGAFGPGGACRLADETLCAQLACATV